MYDLFGAPGFLAAYNAGPARYAEHLATGRALPRETRAYVAMLAPMIGSELPPDNRHTAVRPTDWRDAALFVAPADGAPTTVRPQIHRQPDADPRALGTACPCPVSGSSRRDIRHTISLGPLAMMGMRRNRTAEVYRAVWRIKRCATDDRGRGWRDKRARCAPRLWGVISGTYRAILRGAQPGHSLQLSLFCNRFRALTRCAGVAR